MSGSPVRLATMFLDSWAGRTSVRVRIVGETPKYYRVVLLDTCIKGGEGTELKRVPKYALHFIREVQDFGPLFGGNS